MLVNLILASVTKTAGEVSVEGLISDLAFILILGAIVTVLFKWLKQPVVLGYIVAGFLASPNFEYLPSVTTATNIEFWAQIGIVVLLFSLGLEFSFKKLLNAGGSAVVTALIIVSGMMFVGFAIGHILGFSSINCLFLGGMLSMSSTTIIIKAFNDLGLRHNKFASLVLAVLIVEDLFAVLMMVILSSIAINKSVEGGELLYSVAKLTFFLVMWFLVGVFALPTIFNKARRFLSNETLLIVSIGLCFGMAVFSVGCGFSLALGAFVMGSILAGTSFAERIEHVVSPVKDLFGAVFFISVGMMVEPDIIVEYWSPILLLSAVVIVGMIVFGSFGMLLTGQNLKVAIQSGFSLTQIGEFAFIIATLGMQLGVLQPTIYPIVVAVSVITTFTTPYFIRMAPGAYSIVLKILPKRLHFLIDRYSDQAQNESETGQLWSLVMRRYMWRVLLYSMILVTLTILSLNYFVPWMVETFETWGKLLAATISLFVMAPFLLALSYPASKKTERERLREVNAHFDVPLIVMSLFRMLISLAFIVYLLSHIFSITVGWTCGIAIFVIIIMVFSKSVRKRMKAIEEKFMENLNERELRRSGRKNNLVSNMHLAYMHVGYSCPFVGEKFKDSDLRRRYGVNIAGIQRGSTAILVPGADTRIFPGDQIAVIGTDEQIQNLLPIVEADEQHEIDGSLSDIKMENIQLSDESPIVGKTIANSGLRDVYQILLVSIQRNEEFINPDGEVIFQPHDILWVVGTKKQIKKLR